MRVPLLAVTVLFVAVLMAAPAFAQEAENRETEEIAAPVLRIGNDVYIPRGKMRLGPFRFHPFLSERYGQDDNVFQSHKNTVKSSVLITEAGARFDLAHRKQLLLLGYRILLNSYGDKDARDNTEHEGDLNADLRFGSLFVKLKDSYAHLYGQTPVYFKLKSWREQNRGRAGVGFDLSKLYVEASYENRSYHFEGDYYDRASNKQSIVSGEVGYKFSPKTQLRLKYDSGSVVYDYDIQNDYKYSTISFGVHYRLTGKLLSYLYAGSTSQSVDIENNKAQKKEFSGVTASGSLAYKFSPKTSLNMTLLREIQYNAYVNYMLVNKVQVTARYQWTAKIMASLRLTYENSKPSEKTVSVMDSTRIIAGLSAKYDFTRWLSFGVDYEFANRSSDTDHFKYTNNTILVFVTMYF